MRIKSTDTQPYYEENGAGENQNKYFFFRKIRKYLSYVNSEKIKKQKELVLGYQNNKTYDGVTLIFYI